MWILALDVGTSSIRAIRYDALGRLLPAAGAALLALGALGRPAPPPEPPGPFVRPAPRRRDIDAAARTRQGRLDDSVVGPRVP